MSVRNTRKISISEKMIGKGSGPRKLSSRANGIPKSVTPKKGKTRPECICRPSRGLNNGFRSAIDKMAAGSACYIHSTSDHSRSSKTNSRKSKLSTEVFGPAGTTLYHKRKTLDDAVSRCRVGNAKWRKQILEYAHPLFNTLSYGDKRQLKAMMGKRAYAGPIRASDFRAMQKFGLTCARVVDAYWREAPAARWFHITLFDDALVSERKPDFALKRLKAKIYKEIQELGLNGLAWIDVDPLPNYPQGGEGGSFMFHGHVLAFTEGAFDLKKARAKLKKSRSWSSSLRAKPTHIREITTRMGTPAWWANYGAKPPYKAKRAILRPDGKVKLKWTAKGYRPQIAFRLLEGMAQLALMDTFFAVGEGKHLREAVRKRLSTWHSRRWPEQRGIDVVAPPIFKRAWQQTRVDTCRPWNIIGSSL